jgi:shikimate kinase
MRRRLRAVHGEIDPRYGSARVRFNWKGSDDMDPTFGDGDARHEDDGTLRERSGFIRGRIPLHGVPMVTPWAARSSRAKRGPVGVPPLRQEGFVARSGDTADAMPVVRELSDTTPNHQETTPASHRIFLVGVSCVGKSTIGAELADLLGYRFYDLDSEVEAFFGLSIERLQQAFRSMDRFRAAAADVLKDILSRPENAQYVIALPPRGLMMPYWKAVRDAQPTIVVIRDEPENIMERIVFFDSDSQPIPRPPLSAADRRYYLREIRADVGYFRSSYARATLSVDIAGAGVEAAARQIQLALKTIS